MREYPQQLTLFTEDSLVDVNPSVWQESKKGRTTTGIFGLSFRDWSENLNQIGLSLKTYLVSCISQQTMFAGTWSVKTTRSGYGIMKLRLSEQNTDEKEFSLWRTPDAHCDRGFRKQETFEKRMKRGLPLQLNDQVRHMLPTPTRFDATCGDLKGKEWNGENRHSIKLIQAVKLLPTPVAHDAKGTSPADYKRHTPPLACLAGGSLNPNWIEWLMGFPTGWTDLEH